MLGFKPFDPRFAGLTVLRMSKGRNDSDFEWGFLVQALITSKES